MSDPLNEKAGKPEFCITQDQLRQSLDAIFEPFDDSDDITERRNAVVGLINLTIHYLGRTAPPIVKNRAFSCDHFGASEAMMRFQRDVFGVQRLHKVIKQLNLLENQQASLLGQLEKTGIRINSEDPWKTRIAASFALWMTTFRPISIIVDKAPKEYEHSNLAQLNGYVTHWICCAYLKQFGNVNHGDDPDAPQRLDRIHYDFTYRDLTLSSLEMLYCSLFRPRENHPEKK